MKTKRDENSIYLVLLYTAVLIISNIVVSHSFKIGGESIYFSIFTYPILFLISNIITKKYGADESIKAVLFAIAIQLIIFATDGIVTGVFNYKLIFASILGYLIIQPLNVAFYSHILRSKKNTLIPIMISYILFIILDNMIFLTLMNTNNMEFHTGINMFITYSNLFKLIIAIVLAAINNSIQNKIKAN